MQQYFVCASGNGKSFAAEYRYGFRTTDVLPGGKCDANGPSRLQLLVEHGSNHANDITHHQWLLFGGGFREWMQQHFRGPSGNGASDSPEFGGGFGAPYLLSGRQRDAFRPNRVQLSVEQWSHHPGHHGHHYRFVFCNRIGQWMQQYVDGPAGNGSSATTGIRIRFGASYFVPRKQRDPYCTGGLQLFVEQWCHHPEHFGLCKRLVRGYRFCQWMQQQLYAAGSNRESHPAVQCGGFRSPYFLPGKFSRFGCPIGIRIRLEQWSHNPKH